MKINSKISAGLFPLIFIGIILAKCSDVPKEPETMQKGSSTEDKTEWFREAKFGMFIHWGPYSQFAGEWNGQRVPAGRGAEWIMKIP